MGATEVVVLPAIGVGAKSFRREVARVAVDMVLADALARRRRWVRMVKTVSGEARTEVMNVGDGASME